MYAAPFAMIIGCLLGFLIPSVSARDAFFISPATPANYNAAKEDLDKIPRYLEASQCGGWEDRSVDTDAGSSNELTDDVPALSCYPVINCKNGTNLCNGFTGFTSPKNPDGSVPVCVSGPDNESSLKEYILLHELVHVKQFCLAPPPTTATECCAAETEAYTVQCNAEAADGIFTEPINGIQLTVENCISYGNRTSCRAYGANPCNNVALPNGYDEAIVTAVKTRSAPLSCADILNNPSPRLQGSLDDFTSSFSKPPESGLTAIPTVKGVPGRNGVWNGKILSGMGTRKDENSDDDIDNDFIFPSTGDGLSTSCSPNKTSIKKTVWRPGGILPGEIVQEDITYPHPQFTDPSCRWRPKDGEDFKERAPDIPLKPLDQYDPPPTYGELNKEPKDRQSPENCKDFCSMLNSYQYYDCLEAVKIIDPLLGEYFVCKNDEWVNKYLCSDQRVNEANGACNTNSGDKANSIKCMRGECRCQEDGGPNPGEQCIDNPGVKVEEAPSYYSYYRFFRGEYAREAVTPEDGDDIASDSADVACYGFYDEFDPKNRQTVAKDRRCVINFNLVDRPDTQKEKGEYGKNSDFEDRDVNDPDNQRTPYGISRTPGNFNKDQDLWYLKLGGGFSLLNEEVFSGSYSNNLTNVFLNNDTLDTAKIRATEQLERGKPFASGSYIRAFDDTGERSVASWWQTQQSAVAEMLHPPVVRMILPSGWAMGVDPADPYFNNISKGILKPFDKRNDRIEVQLNAEDDTLGSALSYLERSLLLHVIEEPVPAIVPVGSAIEFRGRAEAWCGWYMRKNNKQNCDDAPQKVKDLIKTLETYATDIEQYRLLRSELALYASKILTLQQSVTKPISDWIIGNIDSYTALISQQKILQEQGGQAWREVQQKMETFGSVTNMPWCMNQRFTMPIYSLLDEWLPARTDEGSRSADGLPLIDTEAKADIVIDLSAVAFMSGTVVLPVLQPVQVRVTDFPSPPAPNEKEGEIPEYPDLPSISAIQEALSGAVNALPKPRPLSKSTVPLITFKTMSDEKIAEKIGNIFAVGNVIDQMDDRYKKFWKSMSPLKSDEAGQDDRNGIKQMKERLECYAWDSDTCQHVEMDLRERFMRIGSRPLVFLQEDYTSADNERLVGGPCVAELDVCSPIHPEEGGEKHLWEIIGPRKIKDTLEELRTAVRKATLPVPFGNIPKDDFPHYGTTTSNLLPSFNVPRTIELFPQSSSSSSSI